MADRASQRVRDLRLDFFRGLSLFFIFIDHIPGNFLSYFTLQSIAFCDAAEVFIFISGFTAALVYGRRLQQNGALYATAQVYRRVWQLYVAHIFLFMIFTAEVSYVLMTATNGMNAEELGVGDFLDTPHLAVIRALFLVFQPTFFDILPLYIVLLGVFPLVLIGLQRHPLLPLVVSAVVYALTWHFGWALYTYPGNRVWYFNPLAWQFLFVIGATAGHSRVTGRWPFPSGPWFSYLGVALSAIIFVVKLSWTLHWAYDPFPAIFLQLWNYTTNKTNLAPLRLLDLLALAVATTYFVRADARFLQWRALRPVVLSGQHSLQVFCLGILLSVLGHFVLSEIRGGVAMQIAVSAVGILLMIGTAALLEWYKEAGRPAQRPPAGPIPAAPSE
jgi:hypothetical protein